ncbi:bifunctional diguanylate cyclase/phosphodiesterase [Agrobacterium sp. O3.4]|uniref:Bifunctional diguanylate cyclase/phosphodiesterase n=1 Tax=Agrobacterium cucumeris TaxID=2862866 RepID=A0ABY8RR01_9HYPH|nr:MULTISPECIES: bifunctional diguanylate cyclase/phosphodiesterase [Rhizobium/Agrobacterium group]MCZ7469414.1 bifunctional diguanylate cyclase/phosphodiesterase [Rhizobium rhizogenes]MDA5635733.1 bifunctional diguanylate cyclase/phosphodiesterase [Agrobacterium sp. ST15.16.024]MDF1891498.1 bifunctional diguanylate cyclase/phosphodiesterase [Rhizobium rhizogenes]WHO09911.1 bifunctional diguanylate cyclase/phosphodiesterase [Agrobacterium cucumeris]
MFPSQDDAFEGEFMRIAPRNIGEYLPVGRRTAVGIVLSTFALVLLIVTALVLSALSQVREKANLLDNARSRETTAGALVTFREQLGATLNDYAAWDDAAEYVYAPDRFDWIASNYGDMTVNNDLFDTAVVLDEAGGVRMAYQNGKPVTWAPDAYFAAGLEEMIERVRAMRPGITSQVTGFVKTDDGVAATGVALVRLKSGALPPVGAERRYLIFARHLKQAMVDKLARNYVIDGLELQYGDAPTANHVDIVNPLGDVLARLVWRSHLPGDVSFHEARPVVFTALGIAGTFFLVLLIIGSATLDRLKADEAAAREEALRDRLSGLSNRAGLFARLNRMVGKARHDRTDIKLLYLDLDGFKEINDSYGHAAGDRLIKGVAAALRVLVPEGAVLARLGGDEFAIAIQGNDVWSEGRKLCLALLELFTEPFSIGERVASIGCSIGTSVSRAGDINGEELLRRADMAMYQAKENGRGRYVSYELKMDALREEKLQLEADLRCAILNDEITVVYQPVVNAATRCITGVEALARWQRPGHGFVPPDIFIAAAETSGLIDRLGLMVLHKACETARQWPSIKLSVNISPVQFRNPAFSGHVADILAATQTPSERLRLEMTEGYFIQHPERAGAAIDKLKQLGLHIALDDFGAGFASVGYLRRFGFDRMKIDRSLVVALEHGGRSLEMLQATVALAKSLDIPVTAEGIETEEQAAILHLCGCDELQGYLFSKPVAAEDITIMVEAQNAPLFALRAGA